MEKKYRLKGHESFILREGWLNKGLETVYQHTDRRAFRDNYGADELGVGTNMAKAIRYWLKAALLTNDDQSKDGISFTEIGQLIYDNDRYFEDIFTLWIIHINICRNASQATTWNLFFNQFDMEEFTKDELFHQMKELMIAYAGTDKFSDNSLLGDCDAILQMYTKKRLSNYDPEEKKISPFYTLGLLKCSGLKYSKAQPNLNLINKYVFLYAMQESIQSGSCSIDELVSEINSPGRILNLKRTAVMEYLDQLSNSGYLVINHTAGLDMVYQQGKLEKKDILQKYYEEKELS